MDASKISYPLKYKRANRLKSHLKKSKYAMSDLLLLQEKLTAFKLHLTPLCVHGEQREVQGTGKGDGQPGGR